IVAADLELVGGWLPGQHTQVKSSERSAFVGGGAEDFSEHRSWSRLRPIRDERAIHQEQGLGNCPHHVFVGNRRIDAEEPVEKHPRSARAPDGGGLLANL